MSKKANPDWMGNQRLRNREAVETQGHITEFKRQINEVKDITELDKIQEKVNEKKYTATFGLTAITEVEGYLNDKKEKLEVKNAK